MNLNDINNLTNKILSESTHQKDDFLNRWPYTSPYLEEKHTPETKKEENLAEIAPAIAGVIGRMAGGAVAKKGAAMAGKSMLKKKAANVAGNVVQNKVTQKLSDDDEEMSEELNPKLKAIDAKNKARVEAEGRAAAAERQKKRESADAYRKHKNEVMAKGGRPVDALDSWMRKKLGMEHVETVSKLIESNQFSEEELLKIIESM